jgi:nicotinamidase/pyrazinamidase
MKALIIVDVQNAFLEGGEIQVCYDVNNILPYITKLQNDPIFSHIIVTQHVYPTQLLPNKTTLVEGISGTEINKSVDLERANIIIKKQTYSAFETDNTLLNYLLNNKIKDVYICGLAYDYCVKQTAISSVKYEFNTHIIKNATKSYSKESEDLTTIELLENNVIILSDKI